MRWPLRNQILIRMLLLTTLVTLLVGAGVTQSAIQQSRSREESGRRRLLQVLEQFRFPLTQVVLDNISGLSGAELAVVDGRGLLVTRTSGLGRDLVQHVEANKGTAVPMVNYDHSVVRNFQEQDRSGDHVDVHVFVPRDSFGSILWKSSQRPLLVGLLVVPIAFLISIALANQVTRPLEGLKQQVHKISAGDHSPIPPSGTNDEIGDLESAFNQMAVQLSEQEEQLKQNERLQTLVQIGSSTGHHLRNSATGCRMAIELLASQSSELATSENLEVALRQLELMDSYIGKLLTLSNSSRGEQPLTAESDASIVLEDVAFLLRPTAEHLGVGLKIFNADPSCVVGLTVDDLRQLMLNLVGNAITAARTTGGGSSPKVEVHLACRPEGGALIVRDNGPGPPKEVAEKIWEPFTTSRSEGTGLGLYLVKELATQAMGAIDWTRNEGWTEFTFQWSNANRGES